MSPRWEIFFSVLQMCFSIDDDNWVIAYSLHIPSRRDLFSWVGIYICRAYEYGGYEWKMPRERLAGKTAEKNIK